ncbi:MAG: Spy/CpxP family protein refolding chaperone [Alphaproteobacteria bacterium]|nr:Spy/CpxP family protein refolding chaperone [Alphaproteobacteria bacterium]
MIKLASPLSRTATLAAILVGSLAVSACSSDYDQNTNTAPQAAMAAPAQSQPPMHHQWHGMKEVESRIQTLHDKLQITPEQEASWSNVADTMRDNEGALDQLIQERHANPQAMTAIDDLQSYQRITQARADGMQKMVVAFSSLYDQMSDAQKKNADEVFGRFEGHRGGHHHGAKKHHSKK